LRQNRIDEAEAHFDTMASEGDIEGLFGAAWTAYRKGRYDQSGFWADYIASKADGDLRAAAHFLQGKLDIVVGHYKRARGRLRNALSLYQDSGNQEGVFRCALEIAAASIYGDDPATARAFLLELDQSIAETSGAYWYRLSQATFALGNTELALEQIERAFILHSNNNEQDQVADVLAEWGWQLLLDGTYESGWVKTQEALELAKSQRIKAYFLVNEILFRKCQNQDFYSLQEEIEAMALSNNDKLLMRFLEKALSYPCKEE
jgi:tetratricopeptide (TPR) repeat protein